MRIGFNSDPDQRFALCVSQVQHDDVGSDPAGPAAGAGGPSTRGLHPPQRGGHLHHTRPHLGALRDPVRGRLLPLCRSLPAKLSFQVSFLLL
jgi:hypothetical protein